MAKIAFSDVKLRSLPPPERGQLSYWDETLPSFGCRVSQGGTKTFVLNRDNSLITIGRFPILSLSKARGEAKRLLAEFTLGRVRPQSITYQQAVQLFLEDKAKARRSRTVKDYKRLLNRLPFKGQLSEITHEEASRKLDRFTSEGERDHLLVAAKVFWNWCIKRRYTTDNPFTGLSTHTRPTRARVLSDDEIRCIWRACEADRGKAITREQRQSLLEDPPSIPLAFCTIVKLLILTGQRRGEIAALRSDFFKDDLCTLPASLTKNGREHLFPIGALCAATLPRNATGYLFPARGTLTKPFNGWSKSKAALDKISGVSTWTLHDLRRTFATRLADLGTAPHIIERLLNHITGTVSGVAAIYNRATYLPEMRESVDQYEQHLLKVLKKA